jgi:hypothetical protein
VRVVKPYRIRVMPDTAADFSEVLCADVMVTVAAHAEHLATPRSRREQLSNPHDMFGYALLNAALHNSWWEG